MSRKRSKMSKKKKAASQSATTSTTNVTDTVTSAPSPETEPEPEPVAAPAPELEHESAVGRGQNFAGPSNVKSQMTQTDPCSSNDKGIENQPSQDSVPESEPEVSPATLPELFEKQLTINTGGSNIPPVNVILSPRLSLEISVGALGPVARLLSDVQSPLESIPESLEFKDSENPEAAPLPSEVLPVAGVDDSIIESADQQVLAEGGTPEAVNTSKKPKPKRKRFRRKTCPANLPGSSVDNAPETSKKDEPDVSDTTSGSGIKAKPVQPDGDDDDDDDDKYTTPAADPAPAPALAPAVPSTSTNIPSTSKSTGGPPVKSSSVPRKNGSLNLKGLSGSSVPAAVQPEERKPISQILEEIAAQVIQINAEVQRREEEAASADATNTDTGKPAQTSTKAGPGPSAQKSKKAKKKSKAKAIAKQSKTGGNRDDDVGTLTTTMGGAPSLVFIYSINRLFNTEIGPLMAEDLLLAWDFYNDVLRELGHMKVDVGAGTEQIILAVHITMADVFCLHKQYEHAIHVYDEIVNIETELYGAYNHETIASENLLATLACKVENWFKAAAVYEVIGEKLELKFGTNCLESLIAYQEAAFCLASDRRAPEAIVIYKRIIKKLKKVLGPSNEKYLQILYNYASTQNDNKSFNDAFDNYHKVFDIRLKQLGQKNSLTIICQSRKAYAALAMGRVEKAIELLKWAIEARKKAGEESGKFSEPALLSEMTSLVIALVTTDKLEEALKVAMEVGAVQEKVAGSSHYKCMITMYNQAIVVTRRMGLRDSIMLLKRIMSGLMAIIGVAEADNELDEGEAAKLLLGHVKQHLEYCLKKSQEMRFQPMRFDGSIFGFDSVCFNSFHFP